jgi:gliding motility-associated lipoprotein GldB
MHLKYFIYCLIFFVGMFSCQEQSKPCAEDPVILSQELDLKIHRLEKDFFEAKSVNEVTQLLTLHPEFAELFLQSGQYESQEVLAQEVLAVNQDSIMQELYQEVMIHYPSFEDITSELEIAFKHIKYYFPEFRVPKVYTFVSGFGTDLLVHEDIIVIGLDYFLPADHRFQPDELPKYISKRYQKEYIIPTLITAISTRFNQTDFRQNTLLAEMIYYGKSYHFTKSILPCTPEELIIGYSSEDVEACFANESIIWAHFVEKDLLFETNPFIIRKYIGEAPNTDEISDQAPGRVGRWLGWNIVDDYRGNEEVSLSQLMAETDTDKIFRLSKYKPRL